MVKYLQNQHRKIELEKKKLEEAEKLKQQSLQNSSQNREQSTSTGIVSKLWNLFNSKKENTNKTTISRPVSSNLDISS